METEAKVNVNLISPKDIYKEVLKETSAILYTMEAQSESVELSNAIETARNSFTQLKSKTDNILQEFDNSAEWEVLTIAFYGETNAGKSTIIETLRILMGEKTKQEQQQKFRQICKEFNIDEYIDETLKKNKQDIDQYEEELKELTSLFVESQAKRKTLKNELVSRAKRLSSQIKALPFWRHGLSFVWKIKGKEELNTINEELSTCVAEIRRYSQEQELKESKIISKIDSAKKKVSEIDIAMKELKIHEDGAIIGDGQSDFTQESTSYEFTANGSKFVLLDMPGIEGKEELVSESIMQAVRKAHAVFYVTRKAEPPQKGDEKNGEKGTLEKIKEHLGSQTEVWTIFNKSIKSAEQLSTPQLVSKGELDSLKILEDEMCKQLGEHYAGSLSLSAHPAFVASTDHFLPGNSKSKDRRKFLNIMDAAGILQKTDILSLVEKIGSDIAENAKVKIRRSNFNKANEAILQLTERVSNLNKNNFMPLLERLNEQACASILQLESAKDALRNNVESAATLLFRKTRDNIRKSTYNKIESKIGNNDFKGYLEGYIQAGIEKIQKDLPDVIQNQIVPFQEEVKDIANQFQEHLQEFIDDSSKTSEINFTIDDIKIDKGISVSGLISTLIGAVTLALLPGPGWVLLAGCIAGILISAFRALKSAFSSNYKQAQQKKVTDKSIDKIFSDIKSIYISQLEENTKELEENLAHIKSKFQLPAQQAEQITSSLSYSVRRLKLLSKKIINESEL